MTESNAASRPRVEKPYPEFPLTPHRGSGQWSKVVRGRTMYFGKLDDPAAALARYEAVAADLNAGRAPRPDTSAMTVRDVVNAYLTAKEAKLEAGELKRRTWAGYKEICGHLLRHLDRGRLVEDLRPDDFARLRARLARTWGPHRLGNGVQMVRSIFRYAFEAELLDRAVRFGPDFKGPSARRRRVHRAQRGPNLFTAAEVRRLLDVARPQLRAMVLLGVNCGFGNHDCATLPLSALDLDGGWVTYPRPKTGAPRRAWLWPETVAALRTWLASRPRPKAAEDAGLVFVTRHGRPWVKPSGSNQVANAMSDLLKKAGIGGRKGRGQYTLRHLFRTVADESRDQPACDFIAGHASDHISAVYRETISDARLRAVGEYVRAWLFGAA